MAQSGQQFLVLFQNKTPFISVCFHPRHLATKPPALSLATMIQSAKSSMWQRAERSKVMPLTLWHSEVRTQSLGLCSAQAHIESVYPENSPLMELERWLFSELPLRICLLNIRYNLIMLSVADRNVDSLLCLKRFTGNLYLHDSARMHAYIQIWYIMTCYKTNGVWHWIHQIKCTIFEYTLKFGVCKILFLLMKLMLLFSKHALNWSTATVKIFIIQKFFISSKLFFWTFHST